MELTQNTKKAMEQFNQLLGNMFVFNDEDMAQYDNCYADVFSKGVTFSYMSSVFFAQFSTEFLIGLLSSNPLREYVIKELDNEKTRTKDDMTYWHKSMPTHRFGTPHVGYVDDTMDVMNMVDASYIKISSMNEWFGTEEGKKEFENYCLSKEDVRDIKRVVCEYPYLIRRYDYSEVFANEIMEYVGIIVRQIADANPKESEDK